MSTNLSNWNAKQPSKSGSTMDRAARQRALRAKREQLKNKKSKLAEVRKRREEALNQQKGRRQQRETKNNVGDISNFINSVIASKPKAVAADMAKEEAPVFQPPSDSNFQLVPGGSISIDPKAAREVYEKSIQVTTRDVAEFMGLIDFDAPPEVQDRVNLTTLGASKLTPWSNDMTVTIEPEAKVVDAETTDDVKEPELEDVASLKTPKLNSTKPIDNVEIMNSSDRREVYSKDGFSQFFDRSSLLIERCLALNQDYNIFVDFSKEDHHNREAEQNIDIKHKRTFALEETKERPVTCLSWSKLNPELFLTTYASQKGASFDEPDGLLVVWNVILDNRPEYVFQCQSMITVAEFHPSNPKLVLGCTLSGQLLLWDMRENKRTPVFRSQFISGHTQAIFAMSFIPSAAMGTEQILTVSHDAKICVWRDDMLSDPHEMEFKVEGDAHKTSDELTTSCFSIPVRDTNVIVLGSDTGRLFSGLVYSDQNPQPCAELKAHNGPITNLEFHPPNDTGKLRLNPDTLQLFLTSSFDWTVKLWDNKNQLELHCFDTLQDYVHDVRWSPVHPAVFACVDGLGRVSIFNLVNKDFGQPVVNKVITNGCGICRCDFSQNGKQLLFGDADGNMHLFEVAEELYNCSDEELQDFQAQMLKLVKATRLQKEEEEAKQAVKQQASQRRNR